MWVLAVEYNHLVGCLSTSFSCMHLAIRSREESSEEKHSAEKYSVLHKILTPSLSCVTRQLSDVRRGSLHYCCILIPTFGAHYYHWILLRPPLSSSHLVPSVADERKMVEFKDTAAKNEEDLDQDDAPLLGEDIFPQRRKASWTLYIHGALIALYTSFFIILILSKRPGLVPSCFDPDLPSTNHAHKPCTNKPLTSFIYS